MNILGLGLSVQLGFKKMCNDIDGLFIQRNGLAATQGNGSKEERNIWMVEINRVG